MTSRCATVTKQITDIVAAQAAADEPAAAVGIATGATLARGTLSTVSPSSVRLSAASPQAAFMTPPRITHADSGVASSGELSHSPTCSPTGPPPLLWMGGEQGILPLPESQPCTPALHMAGSMPDPSAATAGTCRYSYIESAESNASTPTSGVLPPPTAYLPLRPLAQTRPGDVEMDPLFVTRTADVYRWNLQLLIRHACKSSV